MHMVYRSLGFIKSVYNQLNPATLTGAIDIVVIEQEDGTLLASPFHVRFGKLGVLRAKEKLVKITVNNERIPDLHMKLGDQGEAFFVQEIVEEEEIPTSMITSPIPSRPSTPCDREQQDHTIEYDEFQLVDEHGKRKRRKKRKKRAAPSTVEEGAECSHSEGEENAVQDDNKPREVPPRTSSESSTGKNSDDQQLSIRAFLSDSEVPEAVIGNESIVTPYSDSEANIPHNQSEMMWGWGELPAANEPVQHSDDSSSNENDPTAPAVQPEVDFRDSVSDEVETTKEIPADDKAEQPSATSSQQVPSSSNKPNLNGMYLADVLSLDPSEKNLYLNQPSTKLQSVAKDNCASLPELASSPGVGGGSDIDSGTDSQTHEEPASQDPLIGSLLSGSRLSLCGFASGSPSVDEVKFREKEVNFETFLQSPGAVLNDPNLVVKVGDRYMNWQTAAPALVMMVIYKQPLTKEYMDRLLRATETPQSKGIVSWFWRKPKQSSQDTIKDVENNLAPASQQLREANRIRTITEPLTSETENEVAQIILSDRKRSRPVSMHGSHNQFVFTSTTTISGGKLMRKTTRLNSKQLTSLNLKEGENKIVFSVTSQYQGTSRCQATIYRWKWSDKIVVSDIDGTITKSDVFGQILPVVGKDWTQNGVAKLFQNIGKNGYKFMYLSARAIGQASMTKDYLNWINQQGVSLPAGPLFLSPTSLMIAFRREVIEKRPEKFKIDCLTDIKALFPSGSNPFSAGFGNKPTDVKAYQAVGIPESRMFTINHKGELRQERLQTYKTSYRDLGDATDHFFPPLHPETTVDLHSHYFSDFSFWRDDAMFDSFNDFSY